MNKIKLLITADFPLYPHLGGREISLVNVLQNLCDKRFDITLLTTTIKIHEDYLSKIPSNVKIVSLFPLWLVEYSPFCKPKKPRFIFRVLINLYKKYTFFKAIKQITPDVILDYIPFFATKMFMSVRQKQSIKLVAWHHGDFEGIKCDIENMDRRYKCSFVKTVDGIIFPSNIAREQFDIYLSKLDKINKCESYTVYNGLDLAKIKSLSNKKIDNRLINQKYILMVARLDYGKDYDTLIKALYKLQDFDEDLHLVICGDGVRKQELVKLASSLKLQNKVHFLGAIENPYIWMKNCQAFVLSTEREGFGIVIVEAIAVQAPVIVSDIPPCIEAIDYGKCGFIFKLGNVDDLVEKIKYLFNRTNDLSSVKQNQEIFIKNFDQKLVIRQLESIIAN